ncbi:MAG: hypothetical protein R3B48_18350 [Kofleriaceae bacterium]
MLSLTMGCYAPTPATGLSCTNDNECPDEQICSPSLICVSPRSLHLLDHDRAIDFEQPGSTLEGAEIDAAGGITSRAWLTHGLRFRAIAQASFDSAELGQWDELTKLTTASIGTRYSSSVTWSSTPPPGLDVEDGRDLTLLLDGEIFLDAGAWKLELVADDVAFLELAAPREARASAAPQFERVLGGTNDTLTATYQAPVSGWYEVRLASSNTRGGGELELRGDHNGSGLRRFEGAQLRFHVPPDLRGLMQDAFDSPHLLHWRSSRIVESLRSVSFDTGAPPGVGISSSGEFSLRWEGQFLVEGSLDGFTLTTEGGHRLWIDGALRADQREGSATSKLTGLALAPGWHDIVLDLEKRAPGRSSLTISDPVGDPTVFERGKLRPVLSPARRWLSTRDGTDTMIPDPGSITKTLSLPRIEGSASELHAELVLDHTAMSELSLNAQSGSVQVQLAAPGTLAGSGRTLFDYDLARVGFPLTVGGSWAFTIADTVAAAGTGQVTGVTVTSLYASKAQASEPFARDATFTSAPQELGDVVSFGRAMVELSGDGARASIALRSGATAAECEGAAWSTVDAEGVSAVPAAAFVQYQVTVHSSGLAPATLDRFLLEYWTR